jgi:cell division protein FtsN
MRFQRGNTFLGFILGLAISLGLAAIVAVFWSDIPAGMLAAVHDKSQNNAASGAISSVSAPVKMAEPNKTYEKEALVVNAKAQTAIAKTEAPAATEAQDLHAASTQEASPELATERFYRLQAGSFKNPEQAESIKAQLAMIGVEAVVVKREGDDGQILRVIAGPFAESVMKDIRSKIQDSGIQVIAVRAND